MRLKLRSEKKFDAGLESPWVCHCSDAPAQPAPDPLIGEAARANAEVGREALAFSKLQYEENKPRLARFDELGTKLVNQQMSIADANQARANEQWEQHKETFQPLERKVASDAADYGNAADQEREAASAAQGVARSFDAADANMVRSMGAYGINPASGRYAGAKRANALSRAAAVAGASNTARSTSRDKGIALRAGAANFGRNMPNTAAGAFGIALQGAGGASANNAAALSAGNTAAAPMYQGFGTAISGNSAAGNLMLGQYGTQVSAWNAANQAAAAESAGMGQLAGAAMTAAAMY